MRWPDLLTSRLKRRRADSIGSPSPTFTSTLVWPLRAVDETEMLEKKRKKEGECGEITCLLVE